MRNFKTKSNKTKISVRQWSGAGGESDNSFSKIVRTNVDVRALSKSHPFRSRNVCECWRKIFWAKKFSGYGRQSDRIVCQTDNGDVMEMSFVPMPTLNTKQCAPGPNRIRTEHILHLCFGMGRTIVRRGTKANNRLGSQSSCGCRCRGSGKCHACVVVCTSVYASFRKLNSRRASVTHAYSASSPTQPAATATKEIHDFRRLFPPRSLPRLDSARSLRHGCKLQREKLSIY